MFVAYAVMFCLAFTAAVLSAPAVRLLAVRIGALDRPDGARKIHARPTPRLGGVVITVAVFAACGLYLWLSPSVTSFVFATPAKIAGFLAGFFVILGLGIWDDVKGVRPRTKLAFQTLAVVVCFASGFRVEFHWIANPVISGIVSFAVTWFWLVACINSMNLVDGMDGLASGVAFFAGLVIFVVAAVHMKFAVALSAAAVLGSVVGFLMYNFHPAVMFLGDSGSLLLGYVIAILAMAGSLKSHATVALLVPILALGLPIMDTLLAILRRISRRLPVSQADREHIHHRLLAMGLSSRQSVFVLYGACLTLAAGALVVASANSLGVGLMLGLFCLGAVMGVQFVGAGDMSAWLRALGERIRSARPVETSAKTAVFWLRYSRTVEDVSMALEPYLRSVGAAAATIRTDGPAGKVLVTVRLRESLAVEAYKELPLLLASGKRVLLILEGTAADFHLAGAVRGALSDALLRIGQQGIRDTSIVPSRARGFSEGLVAR